MPPHPLDGVPELAGLASYAEAAQVGYAVDENVQRLRRYHWVERRLMATLIARIPAEPVWEVKCALALHQWQCAEHVDALRSRIAEMRNPVPQLDASPDPALDTFLDELAQSATTAELLAGVYQITLESLAEAYRDHLAITNPLVDQPTCRILRIALAEIDDAAEWGRRALRAVIAAEPGAAKAAEDWSAHLAAYLAAVRGIAGDQPSGTTQDIRLARASTTREPDFTPMRDERFKGSYNFDFPPHDVYNMPGVPADERNLALLCKRTLEMDVPEMMASFITQRANESWEFYRDYSRQLWDEARHAMMGTVAFEARGIDWKADIPLNVGFALRLNLHADPLERQIVLYAIEQSLMPGETGKRSEYETAKEAGDALSAHFHDYDWADEVLHAQIGRRMLRRDGITSDEARERAQAIHERTWAALEQYKSRGEQRNWWPEFVRRVLGHESAVRAPAAAGAPKILAE
ncbi:MAG TPA: hypothetical protein VL524_15605 [Gemmatimonadaceae bacterium]|nr:hypothetical protein [Gemmatimonadaceae bacterium]